MAACIAALSPAASASPAAASVTIGQLAPGAPAALCSADPFDRFQLTVTSGDSYVVPATGGITAWTLRSWSHNAAANLNQMVTLKVFRKVADPATYRVVGHDGPRPLNPSTVNTFSTNLPAQPGDVIGSNFAGSSGMNACVFSAAPGDLYLSRTGNLADGDEGDFFAFANRVNLSAVVAPSNDFTLGQTTRNKKKGTATLTVNIPNPGELTASGNGVKAASGRAVISKSVTAGPAQLTIRAKGKKKATLNETGKVKLKPKITYTPTGGDPSTRSMKLKLKLKKR